MGQLVLVLFKGICWSDPLVSSALLETRAKACPAWTLGARLACLFPSAHQRIGTCCGSLYVFSSSRVTRSFWGGESFHSNLSIRPMSSAETQRWRYAGETNFMVMWSHTRRWGDYWDGLVVKSTCSSSTGTYFNPQHPQDTSQLSVAPVPGDARTSSGILGH